MMDMHLQFRIVETVKTLIIYIYIIYLIFLDVSWGTPTIDPVLLKIFSDRSLLWKGLPEPGHLNWMMPWVAKKKLQFHVFSCKWTLFKLDIHYYPLLSIIIHHYPLLSMIIHDYQLLSMICWPYFQHLSAFSLKIGGIGQGHWWNGFCSITSSRWTSLRCEVGWCPKETIGKLGERDETWRLN
jgi:hypothetical protein